MVEREYGEDPRLEHVDSLIDKAEKGLERQEGTDDERRFLERGEHEPVDDTIAPG